MARPNPARASSLQRLSFKKLLVAGLGYPDCSGERGETVSECLIHLVGDLSVGEVPGRRRTLLDNIGDLRGIHLEQRPTAVTEREGVLAEPEQRLVEALGELARP